jgi:hypothetical protein
MNYVDGTTVKDLAAISDDTLVKELAAKLGEHYYMTAAKICHDAAAQPGRSEDARAALTEMATTIEATARLLPSLVGRL